MTAADYIVGISGVLASIAAALLWLKSSLVKMIVSPDTIEAELKEVGRWNARAAFASFIAALCAAYALARQAQLF
jgi:hypothetical protein